MNRSTSKGGGRTRIVLADDHGVVRDGLRMLLGVEAGLEIVGEAADGLTCVEVVTRLRPDILILDLVLPGRNGLDVARELARSMPALQVLFLTMHLSAAHVERALQAGARGYVLKDGAGRDVVEAVRALREGRRYFSPRVLELMVAQCVTDHRTERADDPFDRLSPRERGVLQGVLAGKTSASIARELNLSPKTVDTYRSRLMTKLGVSDLPSLVKLGLQHGLIDLG